MLGPEWEKAHELCQMQEGDLAHDRVHALAHWIEGDESNASYWYRRTGPEARRQHRRGMAEARRRTAALRQLQISGRARTGKDAAPHVVAMLGRRERRQSRPSHVTWPCWDSPHRRGL